MIKNAVVIILLMLVLVLQGFSVVSLIVLSFLLITILLFSKKNITNKTDLVLFSYLIWLLISLLFSKLFPVSFLGVLLLSSLPLAYFLGKNLDKKFLDKLFIFILLALSILALYQTIILKTHPTTLFVQKNSSAAFINILIFCAMGCLINQNNKIKIILLNFLILLAITAMACSWSRGASLSFIIGLILFLVLTKKNLPNHQIKIIILLSLLGFFIAHFITPRLAQTHLGDLSWQTRLVIWQQAIKLIPGHWLFGTGPGTFPDYYQSVKSIHDLSSGEYAHCDYLQLLIELGVPGLILFLLFQFYTLKNYFNLKNKINHAGYLSGLICVSIHSFVTYNFYLYPILITVGFISGKINDKNNL